MRRLVLVGLACSVAIIGCATAPPRAMKVPGGRSELDMTRDVDGNEVFRLVGLSPFVVQRIRERLKEDENAGPEFLRVCMRIAKPAKKPSVEEQPGRFEPPTPILGTYTLLVDGIQFKPRHPISRGAVVEVYGDIDGQLTQKLADLASGKLAPVSRASFVIPKGSEQGTTRVTAVFPSTDVLPENLLKFYVHFSAPMSRGMAYEYVKLYEVDGREVEMPFLELPEELWDPTGRRLTLLLDPGRIKSELLPRRELGPALLNGRRYALVISDAWLDAEGRKMAESFRREFTVGPPDTDMPRIADWKLDIPPASSRKPLTIVFPEPLDHGLLQRVITVVQKGETLAGQVHVSDHERRWQFTPEKPWASGEYSLVVEMILEDLAGNNLKKPFEVDLLQPFDRAAVAETVSLPFRIP